MIIRTGMLALCICFSAAAAYSADPVLDVIPGEITARTLPKETPIQVEVRLKADDAEVTGISLSTFSNDGIVAEFAQETPSQFAKLSPKSEHAWRLQLTRTTGSVLTDSVLHIRVEFDVAQRQEAAPNTPGTTGGTAPTSATSVSPAPTGATPTDATPAGAPPAPAPVSSHRILYASAKIKPPAVVPAVDIARAEIKGVPESLAHERPGRMYVLVTNQYSSPLTVTSVKPLGPSYIDLLDPDAKDDAAANQPHRRLSIRVRPGQTEGIVFSIKPKSQVVPGKYSLIAAVDVETDDKLAATVMTTAQEINVVVLGESDLLKFLGIPSLLFLPGVLMLITWQFLALWGKSDDDAKKYKPQWNTSDFWVIAVALSLITALIYPWLTEHFLHDERDFVGAYGLVDYALILGFSLITSILAFGAARGLTAAWKARTAHKLAQTAPNPDDKPLQILKKLARLKADNLFQQYAPGGEQATHLLRLDPWSTDAEAWFVPRAEIKGLNQADADAVDERDRLVNQPPTDAASVLAKIQEGILKQWWSEPDWRPEGDVRRPLKVPPTGWSKSGRMVPLLQGD